MAFRAICGVLGRNCGDTISFGGVGEQIFLAGSENSLQRRLFFVIQGYHDLCLELFILSEFQGNCLA